MAENETDEPSIEEVSEDLQDETSSDDGEQSLKQTLLSKPMLIKIGAGLVVVLLAAGGAFYFMAEEELPKDEIVTEDIGENNSLDTEESDENATELELNDPSEKDATFEPVDTKLNDADDLSAEESIDLPEIVADDSAIIEDPINIETSKEETEAQKKNTEVELSKIFKKATDLQEENNRLKAQISELEALNKLEDKDPELKLRANQYIINRHTKEKSDYPLRREIKQEPPPEPKWGEFNTIPK